MRATADPHEHRPGAPAGVPAAAPAATAADHRLPTEQSLPRGAVPEQRRADAAAPQPPQPQPQPQQPPSPLRQLSTPAWLRRGVAALIGVLVAGTAGLLWIVAASDDPAPVDANLHTWMWHGNALVYSSLLPQPAVVLIALAVAMGAIAAVAGITLGFLRSSGASLDPSTYPLSPSKILRATQGRFDGEVTITTLVPAHNEADRIEATLASLLGQSRPSDRVIVVADNCSDRTAESARGAGVEVFETAGNREKKAGALNQALRAVLPGAGHNDLILVMDADTVLSDRFLEVVAQRFTDDRTLMALGGIFAGEPGHGLLGVMQRNEYVRYARSIERRRGLVDVLTGTATTFRPLALRTVASARGHALPGRAGDVYDTAALTEDNEITIALKTLGALMVSPTDCTVVTELMPTWRALWRQRLRWQRGAVENIGAYGLSLATLRYWGQQLGLGYGAWALASYLIAMAVLVVETTMWIWFPFWIGTGLVFAAERVITAWREGPVGRLVAAALVPEIIYTVFLDAVFVYGLIQITLARSAQWGDEHAERRAAGAPVTNGSAALAVGVLPHSLLTSGWYTALSAFVAVNTLVYLVLAVTKMLPRLHPGDWLRRADRLRRGNRDRVVQNRSIYVENSSG